jgi:hypothetical protein
VRKNSFPGDFFEEEAKRTKRSKRAKRMLVYPQALFCPFLLLFALFASSSKELSAEQ